MDDNGTLIQIGGAIKHCPLPALTHCPIDTDENTHDKRYTSKGRETSSIGGFIGDGQLAWRSLGPTVEVIDPVNCSRQAAWTFGAVLHTTSPKVMCVCGIGTRNTTHIVIGVDLGPGLKSQGMVGVLSIQRSRLVRAFHFQHKVTSVCMITGGEKRVDPSTLANELQPSRGLLAVGTSYATIYLIDLALDLGDEITSDEVCPASLSNICVPSDVSDLKRKEIIASHRHPSLCLSENISDGKTFRLLGPDDNILHEMPSCNVSISSLLFIPQLASLVVGYSFGSFQLMNLNLVTIDCASPYEENLPPVFSFAYQEPENDPRSFVYLWVCRSSFTEMNGTKLLHCSSRDFASTCSMYAMNYDKKEWIEGHGLWYQGLISVSPRFHFDAASCPGYRLREAAPSRIVSASTVVGTSPAASVMPSHLMPCDTLAASDEEVEAVPELSLSLFCWETNVLDQGRVTTRHFIAIFDINQWYQSQMPSRLRLTTDELCPFMSFHMLDRVPKSVDETLLGGAPSKGTWSRHSSRSHSEKIWLPSSLSYEFNLLTSEGLATYRCPSVQHTALTSLMQQGPAAIVNPEDVFNACVLSGLVPSLEPHTDRIGSSMVSEREHLLDTALEYHLLSLLVQCVVEFSEGKFSHIGCSSQFLLEWAWKKMKDVKTSSETLCSPLFVFIPETCESLSSQSLLSLHQNLTFLSHLTAVITAIRDNAGEVTSLSAGELEGRVQVANLLRLHLQAILWFYHCGLLPQCTPENPPDEASVPFPADTLFNLYRNRRHEIRKLGRSLRERNLLLIDSIMDECGDLLAEIWAREDSGRVEDILYPPPSLHALLSMFLLPGIPTHTKHRIVQYLFLDLASLLSENYLSVLEELVKYPSSFSLSPSLIKLTQAFWLIDNKDFQAGLSVLLDPLVSPSDITPNQHRRIIKAFLYQGEENHALTYTQIRRPPIHELEDIRMNLTLLLATGRIREAFHYQRSSRVSVNTEELLWHFFNGCEQLGRLGSVVHLPLTPLEETSFISFLAASQNSSAQDILLVYYLQQSRYEKISDLRDPGLKNNATLKGHRRQRTRAALVHGYISHLPDVRAQLTGPVSFSSRPTRTHYTKPQPLSAHIRQSSSAVHTPKSRATAFRSSPHSERLRASFNPYTPFRSKSERRKTPFKSWESSPEDDLQEKRSDDMELTRVVFPTRVEAPDESRNLLTPPLFNAASKLATPVASKRLNQGLGETNLLQEDISRVLEDVLRGAMTLNKTPLPSERKTPASLRKINLCSEVASLLSTPPAPRRRSLVNQTPVETRSSETPQSILKVRKILQQCQNTSETESSELSFPLHRSSTKVNQDKSFDKSSLAASEAGGLTPKHLRFDLPFSRRLSMGEERDLGHEENSRPPPASSQQQRKRKRSDSPPLGSPDTPTPRKPLPGFRDYDTSEVKLKLFDDNSEMDLKSTPEKTTDLSNSVTKTIHSTPSKYRSLSEVKDSSRLSSRKSSWLSMLNGQVLTSLEPVEDVPTLSMKYQADPTSTTFPFSGEQNVPSDSESIQESFHSVHSVDENSGVEEDVKANETSVSIGNPLTQLDADHSPQKSSPANKATYAVTYSYREIIGTSQQGKESIEKSYRVVYNAKDENTLPLFKETGDSEAKPQVVTPSIGKLCHYSTLNKTSTNFPGFLPSVDASNKASPLKNLAPLSERSEQTLDNDLDASYVLQFSDSEEEELNKSSDTVVIESEQSSSTVPTETKKSSPSSLLQTLSKQDTVLLHPLGPEFVNTEGSSLETAFSESSSLASAADIEKEAPVVCEVDSKSSSRKLPPDLANIPSLHLTTDEEEIVDLVLKGDHSLSLKNLYNKLQPEVDKDFRPERQQSSDSSHVSLQGLSYDTRESNNDCAQIENDENVKLKEEEVKIDEKIDDNRNMEHKVKEMEIEEKAQEEEVKPDEKTEEDRNIKPESKQVKMNKMALMEKEVKLDEKPEGDGNMKHTMEMDEKAEEVGRKASEPKGNEYTNVLHVPVLEFSEDEDDEEPEKMIDDGEMGLNKNVTEIVLEEGKEETPSLLTKVEKSAQCATLANGPNKHRRGSVDSCASSDSEKTVEFDVSQVPLIFQSLGKLSEVKEEDLDSLEKMEQEIDIPIPPLSATMEQPSEGMDGQEEDDVRTHFPLEKSVITPPPEEDLQVEKTLLPAEINTQGERDSPARLEYSPDNNNICKQLPLEKITPEKAQIEIIVTPSRRSRRLSGFKPEVTSDTEHTTPSTPLRRSSRRASIISTPTRVLSTPSRRQRKVSGASDSDDVAPAPPQVLGESKAARERDCLKKEVSPLAHVPEAGAERNLLSLRELETHVSDGATTPPSASDANVMTPKVSRTPNTPQRKDTPCRRSARIRRTSEHLGTIVEDASDDPPFSPSVSTPTPKKAGLKDDRRTPIKSSPLTPSKTRRLSHHGPSELLLETIREDSELSSSSKTSPVPDVSTAPPLPSTPSRRPRRRSLSAGDPATSDKEKATYLEVLTEERPTEAIPVARRTRRASLSLNTSESSPPKSSLKNSKEDTKNKALDSEASIQSSELPSYTFISPDNATEKMVSSKMLSRLDSVSLLLSNTKHSIPPHRKALKSLPIPSGYELLLDETPVTKRKPRRRKNTSQFSSSVLILSQDSQVEEEKDTDIEAKKDSSTLRVEAEHPDHLSDGIPNSTPPSSLYHLLDGGERVPIKLPRRISKPRSRSFYRRSITSMKIPVDNEGSDEAKKTTDTKPPKKKRTSRKKDQSPTVQRPPIEEAQGFVFQKPEEILSTAHVVSEAFKVLMQEHEKIVKDTFVFSPPLSLDEDRRKKRLEKRKTRK